MPNHECPVGAEVRANLKNLGRSVDELRGRINQIESEVDEMQLREAGEIRRLLIVLIIVLFGSGGGSLLADLLKAIATSH